MPQVNDDGPRGCKLGLRIYERINRPSSDELSALSHASTCDLSDVTRGRGVMDGGIHGLYRPMRRIFGPAVTVDLTPGDGLLLRAAISVARPGDVIVVNGHGEASRAVLGGVIAMHMVNRGVAGLVVDGAVRDVAEFRELDLPVMARGHTPRAGSTASGFGEVNVPVACGSAAVCPGDIVIGDEEGLIVIPRLWAAEVAQAIGKAGHPEFAPEAIKERLGELSPDTPVLGMDRVRRAIAERNGIILDTSFDDQPGP